MAFAASARADGSESWSDGSSRRRQLRALETAESADGQAVEKGVGAPESSQERSDPLGAGSASVLRDQQPLEGVGFDR